MTILKVSEFPALVCFSVLLCSTCFGQGDVVKGLDAKADRCSRLLEKSVLEFYLPASIDRDNGGYLESLNAQGVFAAGDEKFLTFQARQVWFFSNMAVNNVKRETTAPAAAHGYGLLKEGFFDKENGGYFLKINRQGTPTDNRKHVYPLSFVIYSLVELHRVTGDDAPLDQAMDVFDLIDKHCHDKTNGGYHELFADDWQKIRDTEQWGVVGAVGFKTYNSHLHLLEAFTQLYLETEDKIKKPLVRQRLEELVEICTKTVRHPDLGCNLDAWTIDWKMVETAKNLRASYGHDLECAWLVLAAADALESRDKELESWAIALCDHAIRFGFDETHGGFFYSGPLGKPSDDRKKEWWTQSEALVGLLTCFQITKKVEYLDKFEKTLVFIETNHVSDKGGWYATLNEDGSVGKNGSRTSMWQGAYHNGRALRCLKKSSSK